MKCFYHHDRDAVGTCKSCQRGLCTECCAEFRKGLACKGRCENDVVATIKLIDHSTQWQGTNAALLASSRRWSLGTGLAYLLVGVVALVVSYFEYVRDDELGVLAFMGLFFTVFGAIYLRRALSMPKPSKYPLGHCQGCGYDLMGSTSKTCPECGDRT